LLSACRRFPGHGVERLSDEGRQVKELQKRLRNTELELEILKKAIAVLQSTVCTSAIRTGSMALGLH
jgi:hypothetical protein